jgi:hypothetical protein
MFGKFLTMLRKRHSLDAYGVAKMFDHVECKLSYKGRKLFREAREGTREYASLPPELQSEVSSHCKDYLDEMFPHSDEEA